MVIFNKDSLEESIRTKLIPALCGCPALSDNFRDLLSLPCRLGGLSIVDPTNLADAEYIASKEVTAPIVKSLLNHEGSYTFQTSADQQFAVADIKKERKRNYLSSIGDQLKLSLSPDLQRAMVLAQEKGASNWLITLPVEEIWFRPAQGCI